MTKRTVRIFPFAEGIPYPVNGIIVPKVDGQVWHKIFKNKTAVLCISGGFIENLFSLSYFEALNSIYLKHQMEWCGNSKFNKLPELQGLAKKTSRISLKVLNKYPVPVFFNKDKTAAFINCLNNYLDVYSYHGVFQYHSASCLLKQLFRNSMIDWDKKYIPKLRKLDVPDKLNQLAKITKFNLNKKYVLIIPESTGLSIHNKDCLNWSINDIRSFSAMLSKTDYNLVILSPTPNKYYGLQAFVPMLNIENLMYLINGSSVILSKEPDFILAGLFMSDAISCSYRYYDEFGLVKNKKYINPDAKIFTDNNLTPFKIFEILK